jgi:hypothetical protein
MTPPREISMSDEMKHEEKVLQVEKTELSNGDLGNVAGGVTAAAPKKIAVSAGVIAGNKLGGMTPQYPAISEQNVELASQLSDQQLDSAVGGLVATGKHFSTAKLTIRKK